MSILAAIILSAAVFFATFLLGEWLAEGGTLRLRQSRNQQPDNPLSNRLLDGETGGDEGR